MKVIYDKTIEKSCGFLFARWSAGAKAFESLLPEKARIISDPLAGYYAGAEGMKIVGLMQQINPSIRKAIVLRARFFDDYAIQCLKEGYNQVLIMGAGYDSRFIRIPEFREAKIFELDLNSTQVIKKALTKKLLGRLPENVTYIAIDFSRDSIARKLTDSGFNFFARTLIIWEGVTLFLNRDIIEKSLGKLAELARDFRIVFDFIPTELVHDETDYKGNAQLLRLCREVQEPLTFGCDPEGMKKILTGAGLSQIEITSMRQAGQLYYGSDKIEDSYYFTTAESQAKPLAK